MTHDQISYELEQIEKAIDYYETVLQSEASNFTLDSSKYVNIKNSIQNLEKSRSYLLEFQS
jgi:hypothetical protein